MGNDSSSTRHAPKQDELGESAISGSHLQKELQVLTGFSNSNFPPPLKSRYVCKQAQHRSGKFKNILLQVNDQNE